MCSPPYPSRSQFSHSVSSLLNRGSAISRFSPAPHPSLFVSLSLTHSLSLSPSPPLPPSLPPFSSPSHPHPHPLSLLLYPALLYSLPLALSFTLPLPLPFSPYLVFFVYCSTYESTHLEEHQTWKLLRARMLTHMDRHEIRGEWGDMFQKDDKGR